MIGNEERGIFQNFRSSRILQLNDLKKIDRKKSSIVLPIPTFVEEKKVSKKRKYSDIDPELLAQKIQGKDHSVKKREQNLKEKENLVNQYLCEFKIDCPKDFHYENYFEKKRDELQELLLKDPIMSVDELFDLESLKLVFGTNAIKKDGEEMEKNGEEVALRKRKYYDFSGTNVKVDELMSQSPILKDERIESNQNEEYPEISYFENNRHNNSFQPEIHRVQNFCEIPDSSRRPHAQFYADQESLGKQSLGNKNQLFQAPVYQKLNEPIFPSQQFQANESFVPYSYNRTFHQVSQQHPSLQKQPIYYSKNSDGAGAYFIEKENSRYENYDEYTKLYVYDLIPKTPYLIEQPSFHGHRQGVVDFQNNTTRDQPHQILKPADYGEERPIRNSEMLARNNNHKLTRIDFENPNNYSKKHYRY